MAYAAKSKGGEGWGGYGTRDTRGLGFEEGGEDRVVFEHYLDFTCNRVLGRLLQRYVLEYQWYALNPKLHFFKTTV